MAVTQHDLVGRDVYARDGDKIGEIRELVYDGDYAVVRRSIFTKLVVPLGALDEIDGRLTIPHASSYLDDAPRIDTKNELSPKDRALLDSFYMRKAA